MKAETISIVNDLKRVSIDQVVYEAVTNSIHANATEIIVSVNSLNSDLDDIEEQFVSEIMVIDNGDGFQAKDIESFQTYRSRHKKIKFGAKGIGRFLFLKLFEHVKIHSLDKEIKFDTKNDVSISKSDNYSEKTKVKLSKPKDGYQINKGKFVRGIKVHFLPTFKLINQRSPNVELKIDIRFNNESYDTITNRQIPHFEEDDFFIESHRFKISYLLEHDQYKGGEGAYCADDRVVCFNSQMESSKRFKGFKGINFFYLLSSPYFDENLNDERDELTINAKRKSQSGLFETLSWEDINSRLGQKIKEICMKNGIDIDEKSEEYLINAINRAPFLSSYFKQNELMLPEDDLLKQAQKAFNDEKEKIRTDDASLTNSERDIVLNRVVQAELAEYVFDRQRTIERLKKLESEVALEAEFHNLFVERFTSHEGPDYKANNLWLFDDRFMTYDKVFSDKKIKEIFPKLHSNLDQPDLLTISSNTFEKNKITDIVIIELKRPEANNDVAIAESELLKYSRYARESGLSNIRIWTYAFITFDKESDLALDDKSYNKIPVQNGWPIRYRYHERLNTIINFIDYKSLAFDAETRNNTFLNILKAKHYTN